VYVTEWVPYSCRVVDEGGWGNVKREIKKEEGEREEEGTEQRGRKGKKSGVQEAPSPEKSGAGAECQHYQRGIKSRGKTTERRRIDGSAGKKGVTKELKYRKKERGAKNWVYLNKNFWVSPEFRTFPQDFTFGGEGKIE